MSAKPTPGPWFIAPHTVKISVYAERMVRPHNKAGGRTGGLVCSAPVTRDSAQSDQAMANAHLIAAAPDLLEALYQYESDLLHPPVGDSRERRLERVRKVIAKARGES